MTDHDAGLDRTRRPFVIDEGLSMLARTPSVLDVLLRDLPPSWANAHEGQNTWSAFDIVGHLVHGERTDWMPRVRTILEHGEDRPFEPFDRLAQEREPEARTLDSLLDAFAELRFENLESLHALNLTPADLSRRGRHPVFGSVTLSQLLATWVAHDLDHVMQISRVLGAQYSDAVGPWRAYLRVISGTQG